MGVDFESYADISNYSWMPYTVRINRPAIKQEDAITPEVLKDNYELAVLETACLIPIMSETERERKKRLNMTRIYYKKKDRKRRSKEWNEKREKKERDK